MTNPPNLHLSEDLARPDAERVTVHTPRHGSVTGRRARNGAVVFLEVPYALPPVRFSNPQPLPDSYRYEDEKKEFVHEFAYAVQPGNDGQSVGISRKDHLGLGEPSENPLFVNIVLPPAFNNQSSPPLSESATKRFPVRIYIHGGFLQFGSPHSLGSQAQYVAAERNEIWVNVGYRLSAFGFLACDAPTKIDGNFGFKDQWLALEWVRENIEAFGGDVDDIQVTGLSAGAHSVHQILHHASRLPAGKKAPFTSAMLQSNAMVSVPKTPSELRPQFEALCTALSLDPQAPDVLETLRDPSKVTWESIVKAIEEERLGPYGTFRGALDGEWLASEPDPMTWQRSGGFADGLRKAGVKYLIVGDLSEEWYLYAIAHPITTPADVKENLYRYYPESIVHALLEVYDAKSVLENASAEKCVEFFGRVAADMQVHVPVRMFARDLERSGFPVLRYSIRWTPEQIREMYKGYVTHATDRVLWCYREPILTKEQLAVAREWLDIVDSESRAIANGLKKNPDEALVLNEDKSISWRKDAQWDELLRVAKILPGEN
ncbi:carboxylesterase [Schizopora paradoxa]|uniref:Carboxylic ester hydrolase n=1 Tax=Schizopora paradoxa TaxID=27342 RepID=A0A0H2S1G5_9AGAM|nr:carboxylesterase [Schizopora paradoxa]